MITETSADISPYATFPVDETQRGSMPMLHNLTLRQQSIHENYAPPSHPPKVRTSVGPIGHRYYGEYDAQKL